MTIDYHFVGIGGIGMSGLARILLEKGHRITGTDLKQSEILAELEKKGARIKIGHHEDYYPEKAVLVYSTGINEENPEYLKATKKQATLLHRSELLAQFVHEKRSLLVTGTHGKTTTSSLLAHLLRTAGLEPGFAVGGILPDLGVNAAAGNGKFFVAEADESDGSFLKYYPEGAILTNIDLDHMDHFKTEGKLVEAFHQFASQVKNKELLFYCGEDARLQNLQLEGVAYGFTGSFPLQGSAFSQKGLTVSFDAVFRGKKYDHIIFSMPGKHNALNALAVFGMAIALGIDEALIRKAFASFPGVKRRSEKKLSEPHLSLYDDYGHHPSEISATLKAFRNAFPDRRLLVYFQPHRYSRTVECLKQFGTCFDSADLLVLTDIYRAGEKPVAGISAENVMDEVRTHSSLPVHYVERQHLLEDAKERVRPFDIVLTIGAGDITELSSELKLYFSDNMPKKWRLALVYGGQSSEHEISLLSARHVAEALAKPLFDVEPYLIAKNGVWYLDGESKQAASFDSLKTCDIAFPVLHGPNGEDGAIQGFFKIMGIPFASCSTLPSAIAMHKGVTKKLAEHAGIPVSPFATVTESQYEQAGDKILEDLLKPLRLPLFVKPVRLGSTIGVKKACSKEELKLALQEVFQLDFEAIVEEEVKGREIEFAVFGAKKPVVLPPGEVKTMGQIYGYEEKYKKPDIKTTAQADLPKEWIEKGCELALKAYEACGCDAYARVDFFLRTDGAFILNEINPIPGFTATSLYPEICKVNGLPFEEILNILVRIGLERKRREERKGI